MFFYPLAGLPSSALTISRALCDGFGAPIKFLARTSWACGALRVPGYHANSFNRQNRFYVFPRALFFPSKSTYLLHFSWTPRLLLSTGTGLQVIRLPLLCSVIWSLGQTTFIPVELVCFISVASVPPLYELEFEMKLMSSHWLRRVWAHRSEAWKLHVFSVACNF